MNNPNDYAKPIVLTGKQVAAILQITDNHFRVLLHRDETKLPPYFVIGEHKRWYMVEVEKWMKRNSGHHKKMSGNRDLSPAVSGEKHADGLRGEVSP